MRTAKFKKLFYLLIVVGIFILAAPYTARVYQLNQRYPSAQTITGTQNAPITWNGLKIELLNGELVPQESFFPLMK